MVILMYMTVRSDARMLFPSGDCVMEFSMEYFSLRRWYSPPVDIIFSGFIFIFEFGCLGCFGVVILIVSKLVYRRIGHVEEVEGGLIDSTRIIVLFSYSSFSIFYSIQYPVYYQLA